MTEHQATINGQPYTKFPHDLYIPPDALRIFLESFEGPLDLLWYLIRKENIDILDIPIAEITRQYVEYIYLMKDLELDLAAEYLVMAVMLAEIKSRMLLPKPQSSENEEDPRAELIRKLQEYEKFKTISQEIDKLPRVERDLFIANIDTNHIEKPQVLPEITISEILTIWSEVLQRSAMFSHHLIQRESLTIREKMAIVLSKLSTANFIKFASLLSHNEGRLGLVVTFIALLELVRQSMIELVQAKECGEIYIQKIA